ncbi:TPA: glyoxalase/bleomycin resistance/dioxygenase family protein, partial [Clostridioides difficile]|nr:glyoxalase/bleomycin resistance/dioxygenase family protein [Clostridioides difficile]
MKYQVSLLAVKDIEVSKKFYKELFEQEIELDLGK